MTEVKCNYVFEIGGSTHNKGDKCDKKALHDGYCSDHLRRKSVRDVLSAKTPAPIAEACVPIVGAVLPPLPAYPSPPSKEVDEKKHCAYIYVKAGRKGDRCKVVPRDGGEFCGEHRPKTVGPAVEAKCCALLKNKKTQCSFKAMPGLNYCGHHNPAEIEHKSERMKSMYLAAKPAA